MAQLDVNGLDVRRYWEQQTVVGLPLVLVQGAEEAVGYCVVWQAAEE